METNEKLVAFLYVALRDGYLTRVEVDVLMREHVGKVTSPPEYDDADGEAYARDLAARLVGG
jgi:hypothetical protein